MKTPIQDLEEQIRTHYQQEFGEPSPAAELWSKIAGRLPAQEQPATRWQHLRQALVPSRVSAPFAPRLAPARKLLVVCSLLCALLCIAGLVYGAGAGWFSQAHPASGTPASTTNADVLLLTQLLQSDPRVSIQQLAQSTQFTVQQTQTVNANTVRLQKILADANTIVLGYTIDGSAALSSMGGALPPTITLPGGQTLSASLIEFKASSTSMSTNGLLISPQLAVLAYFTPSGIQGTPHQVNLEITIPAGGATAHFQVTVPFYAGKTVTIHQTATSNGQALTLDRVVITPSAARFFYYTTGRPDPILLWSVSLAGKTYQGGGGYAGGFPTGGENSVSIWDDLQDETGTWTVKVAVPAAIGQGSWQFTFAVA